MEGINCTGRGCRSKLRRRPPSSPPRCSEASPIPRLGILLGLADGEQRVIDLVAALGLPQSTISGHLACLKDCGLVADRPQGRAVYYRVATTEVYELLGAAERLLAVTGSAIELCPNYGGDACSATGGPS
jgi:DNA-binding transcriptional ArsR family regulator